MNVYSHAQMHDLSAAVDGLPISTPAGMPTSNRAESQRMKATGTDGKAISTGATKGNHLKRFQ